MFTINGSVHLWGWAERNVFILSFTFIFGMAVLARRQGAASKWTKTRAIAEWKLWLVIPPPSTVSPTNWKRCINHHRFVSRNRWLFCFAFFSATTTKKKSEKNCLESSRYMFCEGVEGLQMWGVQDFVVYLWINSDFQLGDWEIPVWQSDYMKCMLLNNFTTLVLTKL